MCDLGHAACVNSRWNVVFKISKVDN